MKLHHVIFFLTLIVTIQVFSAQTTSSDAASAERKFEHVEANGALAHPDSKPTVFSENEINAYFASGKIKLPDGVQSVHFQGTDGAVTGVARVDFDQIKTGARRSSNPLLFIFSGVHDVEVQAHASGAAGKGTVHVDSVALDGMDVPRSVLQLFVDRYLKPKHPEIGLDSNFELSDKIDSATIGKHNLTLIQK
jgi:hypothetical protein